MKDYDIYNGAGIEEVFDFDDMDNLWRYDSKPLNVPSKNEEFLYNKIVKLEKVIKLLLAPTSYPCPRCDGFLTARFNRYNEALFAGCSEYPACKYSCSFKEDFAFKKHEKASPAISAVSSI